MAGALDDGGLLIDLKNPVPWFHVWDWVVYALDVDYGLLVMGY